MTDWPDVAMPCAKDPKAWEVPTPIVTEHAADWAYRQVSQAVWACRSCPALKPCAEWAALKPPQHHVQAGMVYGHDRKPRGLERWRQNVVDKLAYHRKRSGRAA